MDWGYEHLIGRKGLFDDSPLFLRVIWNLLLLAIFGLMAWYLIALVILIVLGVDISPPFFEDTRGYDLDRAPEWPAP
jgi:hypothetical protein